MNRLHCKLICSSSAESLSQIYTGFGSLESKGLINVECVKATDYVAGVTGAAKLVVIVNNQIRITYDTSDGEKLFESEVASSDFYFKRSYDRNHILTLTNNRHIFPLGFNYPVYGIGDHALQRAIWSLLKINKRNFAPATAQIVRSSSLLCRTFQANGGRYNSEVTNFEALPDATCPSHILLLTRAWSTERVAGNPTLADERAYINRMRADCIRQLRKEFGNNFTGGFAADEFSIKNFKDCVVSEMEITRKRNYMQKVKSSAICIATMGLQRSNGWRLGEYIAAARAILTEKLHYQVPGEFANGRNYMQFTTPEECVTGAVSLSTNKTLREHIMKNNYSYYHLYLRPDILVWNSLQTALQAAGSNESDFSNYVSEQTVNPLYLSANSKPTSKLSTEGGE